MWTRKERDQESELNRYRALQVIQSVESRNMPKATSNIDANSDEASAGSGAHPLGCKAQTEKQKTPKRKPGVIFEREIEKVRERERERESIETSSNSYFK